MINKINKNVIFMGQPGAGKGTVASLLSKTSNLIHLSTGNIFRNEIAQKTELGLKVQNIVTTGGYVPDEITNKIVENAILKLKENNQFFILDGFPRTKAQAEFLNSLKDFEFVVIELQVNNEEIIKRLSGRRTCVNCGAGYHVDFQPPKVEGVCDVCSNQIVQRADDTPERIEHRLKIYEEQTKPLIDYYKSLDELRVVDASATPEEVAKQVLEILQKSDKINKL
ncbi:nucleoside monophosphate kinase [Mycoplasma sp. 2045]|uniref:adenylate kinase family protein n=1 Tax=Mycoplasma sp. 2045 TaxID=2967301 RepID=UPI00211CE396|nr:nucleoside monophosphate kinase [Mycoplasma sp. 2045]UUM20475.1 nucleoside monophosphate kinase [Mycoplasma sp. 2045]